ncbi:hypothetical protein BN1002_01758 [Bacillus sp. B-jedd]|nr:hypothetical protein BN1002_01758 [Bacillus sp. B-jedd]
MLMTKRLCVVPTWSDLGQVEKEKGVNCPNVVELGTASDAKGSALSQLMNPRYSALKFKK